MVILLLNQKIMHLAKKKLFLVVRFFWNKLTDLNAVGGNQKSSSRLKTAYILRQIGQVVYKLFAKSK